MQEITKPDDLTPAPLARYVWIVLAILAVFVYFFGLTIPFLGPDEARYAQVGREMLDRGDWVTPTLGGFNWFEKPALLYWLEIVSYKLFGINEFAARFGPALFGLGTVACLWILGKTVESRESETTSIEQSPTNGFAHYLALIAASTLGIIVFSHGASFDIIITFPVTAALVSFFIWHSKHERRHVVAVRSRVSASLFSFYFFIGIALLAKGLIGIVFPFAIIGVFYLLSRRQPSRTFICSSVWGTLLALAIAAIWYLPMYQRHGYGFIDEFFIQHHFQRFTSNKYQHPQPFYFFLWVLPLMTLPWLPFFLAAIWKLCKRFFHRRDAERQSKSK
ncbi:MAG: glycosyltransferase family 39 protein, partial [Pyrinomonadaceae bacterium]